MCSSCHRDDGKIKRFLDAGENIENAGMAAADNDSQAVSYADDQTDFVVEAILLPMRTDRRGG